MTEISRGVSNVTRDLYNERRQIQKSVIYEGEDRERERETREVKDKKDKRAKDGEDMKEETNINSTQRCSRGFF